ncbi:hypothetical protein [Rhizobium leguminosarum]|uniref:hypothetical protein n=1 Tax=Rhizobium leguminosarum TaxID=384 RepID=UPI002E14CF02|nr:hypothetical protein U8Q02_41310 [Rhizobium leguminosarum]
MERLTMANMTSKITPEAEAQLAAIGAKLGLKFEIGKTKLGTTGADATMQIRIETVSADGKSAEQREFERLAPHYGLLAEDYGRIIAAGRKRFRLVGFNPNAPVNCLRAALCSTGTAYIFSMADFQTYALPRDGEAKKAA